MGLRESFSDALSRQSHEIVSDDVIMFMTHTKGNSYIYRTTYDFAQRCITTSSGAAVDVLPFKDADREVLQGVYDLMVKNNKKPMPLPEEATNGFIFPDKKSGSTFNDGIK